MSHSKKVWYAPNRFESYGEEEIKAVEQCLRDGWLAGFGPRSIEFEEKVFNHIRKKYYSKTVDSDCSFKDSQINIMEFYYCTRFYAI